MPGDERRWQIDRVAESWKFSTVDLAHLGQTLYQLSGFGDAHMVTRTGINNARADINQQIYAIVPSWISEKRLAHDLGSYSGTPNEVIYHAWAWRTWCNHNWTSSTVSMEKLELR